MDEITTNRIYLVGLMGVGKTTIGKRLSRLLGYTFLDTDIELQKQTGADIPWIFELEGEQGFRAREAGMLGQLSRVDRAVIATGGGIVLDETNRALMKDTGLVVYLNAPVNLLLERTRYSRSRPLLEGVDRRKTLESMYRLRDPLYKKSAHLVVSSRRGSARRMAERIIVEITKHERNLSRAG